MAAAEVEKKAVDLGLLEEDDEFEEFPTKGNQLSKWMDGIWMQKSFGPFFWVEVGTIKNWTKPNPDKNQIYCISTCLLFRTGCEGR